MPNEDKNCGFCYWYSIGGSICCKPEKCNGIEVDMDLLRKVAPEDYKFREETGIIKKYMQYKVGRDKWQRKLEPETNISELRCEV